MHINGSQPSQKLKCSTRSKRRPPNLSSLANQTNLAQIQKQHDDIQKYYTLYKEQKILKGFEVIYLTQEQKKSNYLMLAGSSHRQIQAEKLVSIRNPPNKLINRLSFSENSEITRRCSSFTKNYTQKLKKQRKRIARKINHRNNDFNVNADSLITQNQSKCHNIIQSKWRKDNKKSENLVHKFRQLQQSDYLNAQITLVSSLLVNADDDKDCKQQKDSTLDVPESVEEISFTRTNNGGQQAVKKKAMCKITRAVSPQLNRRMNSPILSKQTNVSYRRQIHTSCSPSRRTRKQLNKNWQEQLHCTNPYYQNHQRNSNSRLRLFCNYKTKQTLKANEKINPQPWNNTDQSYFRVQRNQGAGTNKLLNNSLQFSIEDYEQTFFTPGEYQTP